MKQLLFVGLGGGIGAVCRHWLSSLVSRTVPSAWIPMGTMAVNVAGCFMIGLLVGMAGSKDAWSPHWRLFLFTGCLGGFTTYSAFGLESFDLAQKGFWFASLIHIGAHLLFGLSAVGLGIYSSRWLT